MKNWIWNVVVITVATALGPQDAQKPNGVFSMLKVGQPVNLKDEGTAYSFSFLEPEVPLGHTAPRSARTIAAMGPDTVEVNSRMR